jgi:hypothetical protein
MTLTTSFAAVLIDSLLEGFEGAGRSATRGGQGAYVPCPNGPHAVKKRATNNEGRMGGGKQDGAQEDFGTSKRRYSKVKAKMSVGS